MLQFNSLGPGIDLVVGVLLLLPDHEPRVDTNLLSWFRWRDDLSTVELMNSAGIRFSMVTGTIGFAISSVLVRSRDAR